MDIGGGAKGYVGPPSKLLGGPGPPWPPSSYAYVGEEINLKASWLVGCFGLNGPLRQYFSLYRAVSQRGGERKEK